MALTLLGKKKKFNKEHFNQFGQVLGLTKKQIETVFKRFIKNKSKALEWIDASFLSPEMRVAYKKVLEERYLKIY